MSELLKWASANHSGDPSLKIQQNEADCELALVKEEATINKKEGSYCARLCMVILILIITVALVNINHHRRPNSAANLVTFVEPIVECTNDNDGLLTGYYFLASGNCLPLSYDGSSSMDNGCISGTFNFYKSGDCSGPVQYSVPRNTCATQGQSQAKVNFRCSTYSDAEYIRITRYRPTTSEDDCSSDGKIALYSRFDVCYPGMLPNPFSVKMKKINATAIREMAYRDQECLFANGYRDGRADGFCEWDRRIDIVSADVLTS